MKKIENFHTKQQLIEGVHFFLPDSSNETEKATRRRGGARRRPVSSREITYSELAKEMEQRAGGAGMPSKASMGNLTGALRAFIGSRAIGWESVVASTLRASYYQELKRHVSLLRQKGRPDSYIANRKSLLKVWRTLILTLDRECSNRSGEMSPLSELLQDLFTKVSKKGTARKLGIPLATLRRWIFNGKVNNRALHHLDKLEAHFGMTKGLLRELAGKCSFASLAASKETTKPIRKIEYRERFKRIKSLNYPFKPDEFCQSFREQWAKLVRFKTSLFGLGSALELSLFKSQAASKSASPSATRIYTWRAESKTLNPASSWFDSIGDRHCPSANIVFGLVRQYLGWLRLSVERGGLGLNHGDAQTLGHLANTDYLTKYLEWRIERSDGVVNGGCKRVLQAVGMLTHPTHGFLKARPEIGASVGEQDATAWAQKCDDAYAWTMLVRKSIAPRVRASRAPFEPIQHILDLDNPLMAIADAIRRMDANRPLTRGPAEAIWARDRLLFALTASNPLRAKNLKRLTYHADNSGQLRQDANGAWRIVIEKHHFKNETGAARDRPYNQQVQKQVWPYIELYLKQFRPMLATPNSPYLFVSASHREGVWSGLNHRFQILTKEYIEGGIGFGPHGFRHIVATALIKRTGSLTAAALALHDREETVRKHYGHLTGDDAANFISSGLGDAFDKM